MGNYWLNVLILKIIYPVILAACEYKYARTKIFNMIFQTYNFCFTYNFTNVQLNKKKKKQTENV